MVELVDTHDSGSCGAILGGSTPPVDNDLNTIAMKTNYSKPLPLLGTSVQIKSFMIL